MYQSQRAQQRETDNEVQVCYLPHLLTAQGVWDSGMGAWPSPGEDGYTSGRPADRACFQLAPPITRVPVHVPTRPLSRGTVGSLGSGVWLCCTSWRDREGGARQGAWHQSPVFCTYVSLVKFSPFEDSLLMQPGVGSGGAREGATHGLSVCNQWKGLVRSLQLCQGWLLGRSPHPSLILLIACPLIPAPRSPAWPLALTAHTALQDPICPLTCWEGVLN